jgi:amidohydrolase
MREWETSRLIRQELLKEVEEKDLIPVGPTGWVAVVKGEKPGVGHGLLLRADMDALPVQEDADHEPRSRNDGVMHACGHDAHTAVLLGTLQILKKYRTEFSGTIFFFFQPAEEILGGAKLLLETDQMDLTAIDAVAACHMFPDLYVGEIGLKTGAMLASADHFTVTVQGKGGHGAHPYTTVDPIVIASEIVARLQCLVSREINAQDSAVVSVCSIHSDGDTFNVIPDRVVLKGTIRAIRPETRKLLQMRLTEICQGTAATGHASAQVEIIEGPPPFINDDVWVERTRRAAGILLGEKQVKRLEMASMGAEDFAYIKERYPGVFVRIGCRTRGKEFTPIHSSRFTVDRGVLSSGILTLCGIALDYFQIETAAW